MRSLLILLLLLLVTPLLAADDTFLAKRRAMVGNDIRARGVTDSRVLTAMEKVPRHLFVDEWQRGRAYGDHPLPIGEGQTISQPYVVALMTEALGVRPGDRVLEVGTGSGYQAAVLAELVKEVYSTEIRRFLADTAAKRLRELRYTNIQVRHSDGYQGWPEHAPFDAIIITAAANHIPPPLIRQLREGGRLILPLGSTTFSQVLTLVTKKPGGELVVEQLGQVTFVPMTGEVERR